MKLTLALCIAFFLTACAAPTKVHLYGRYLSESNIKNITDTLEESGFDVEANQHEFPTNLNQSTILYSPLIKDRDAVTTLVSQLSELNIAIFDTQPLFEGKHFYTRNNLGLFILPDGTTLREQINERDVANEYHSFDCENHITLNLNANKTYELLMDKLPYPKESDYLTGIWRITQYPYISLGPKEGYEWFYFEIQQDSEIDKLGTINQVKLIGQDEYSYLHFCDFVYGVRE